MHVVTEPLRALKRFLQSLCCLIDSYEESREKQELKANLLFVSFQNDGVYVNDQKIVDRKSKFQIEIIKILIEHYKNEISSGADYISISKICSGLKKAGIDSYNLESQIHISIYRIRKSANKVGISQNIIESSKWNGYRFGERVFIERNRQV